MVEINLTVAIDDLIAILPAVSTLQSINSYMDQPMYLCWQDGWLTTHFHCPNRPFCHVSVMRAYGGGYLFPFKVMMVTRVLALCAQQKRQDRSIDGVIMHVRLKEEGDGAPMLPMGYSLLRGEESERLTMPRVSWEYKATGAALDGVKFMERIARFCSVHNATILRRSEVNLEMPDRDLVVRALPGKLFEVFDMEYQSWITGAIAALPMSKTKMIRTVGQTPMQMARV